MTTALAMRCAATATEARSSAGMSSRSLLCRFGTTKRCPSDPGLMSMNAYVAVSSATRTLGTAPETIPQNKHSSTIGLR
ncbi:Uncharacterised protein [Mycobacteroides abscessus subsp. abscessus]|nr:Uncharacterised protein [Mycobacteroides abscessus subsp. abscessus]